MTDIVITDLTRFSQPIDVCTAGIDLATGECIRPMPYLKMASCVECQLLPGSVLRGDFKPRAGLHGPHREDADYSQLTVVGACSSAEFEAALMAGLRADVRTGFEIDLQSNQKFVPTGHPAPRSIITLAVNPGSIEVIEDAYKPGKVKVHFTDSSGRAFRFLPITDLGFFRYAESHRATSALHQLNAFIRRQEKVYVRLGLSRPWNNGTVDGCWMQVNGIYTFPDFFKDIRSYG